MSSQRRGPWSQAEDLYLCQLVHSQGALNWVRIAQMIGSRSPKQCRERYHQNLKPSLNHAPISAEEGALIERMVGEMGKRWADIARSLHGRSDNAVKNWWNGSMNRRRRIGSRQRRTSQDHTNFDERPQTLSFTRPASGRQLSIQSPTYPPMRNMELPLHSPAGSEISGAESMEGAPSLVSDNGSAFSVSPRLNPSGGFDRELPPMDSYRRDAFRRPSLPSIYCQQALHHVKSEPTAYRTYIGSVSEAKLAEPFLQPPACFRSERMDGVSFHRSQDNTKYCSANSQHGTAPSSPIQLPPLQLALSTPSTPSARDQRMNVTSLLS